MDNSELLNYRIIGNGCPVLFLHGFLESLEMWDYFSLENNFQCILIDLPGHGNSAHFSEAAKSMLSMASEVQKVMNELKLIECTVVGHSMGGYVGLELLELDQRCKKLVLLNSNFWQDSDLKKEDRKRVAEIVKKNKNLFLYEAIPNLFNHPEKHDEAIKKIISTAQNMEATTIGFASIAMAQRKSFENKLAELADKILLIQGEFDMIVPKEKMDEVLMMFPAVQIQYIKSGHMAHIEQTKMTQKVLEDFLR